MASASVPAGDKRLIIQGFREGEARKPYVFIGILDETLDMIAEVELTTENAQVMGEELRKHAEFASSNNEENND